MVIQLERLSKILIIILIAVVASVGFGVFYYVTTIGIPIQKVDIFIPTVSEDNASAYKSSCTELNISQVFENQQALIGTKVKVKGELLEKQLRIVQSCNRGGERQLLGLLLPWECSFQREPFG